MDFSLFCAIKSYNPKVVIFDIDGTLKDLCKEHSEAVAITLEECEARTFNKNVILTLNKIAMLIVKTGLLPTNHSKQNLLVRIFALLSGINEKIFSNIYFANYTKQICLFDGVYELLSLVNGERKVYFATVNKQNYNLEECGILQERIMYTEGSFKMQTYRNILDALNVQKHEVLIVGDNIFDDLLSTKSLGVKCLLVNRYNSKLKRAICKLVNGKYLK